ncbi:MAG: hypothetical protein IT538_06400 [Variibacter sp.]|nr:hypothetical protein [Variibacter sp.]
MADLKKQVEGLTDPVKTFSEYNPLETTRSELEGALADKPAAAAPAAETSVSADAPPAAPAEAALPAAEPAAAQQAAPAVASEPGGRAA